MIAGICLPPFEAPASSPASTADWETFGLVAWLVAAGALLSTFVASVIAEEQDKRIRNGTFGTVAGSAVGGLAALLTSDPRLLIVGFCGSCAGAFLGWLVALCLSIWAGKRESVRTALYYLTGGWGAVRDRLNLEDGAVLLEGLREWGADYARRVNRQRETVLALPKSADTDKVVELVLRNWLDSMTDMLRLLFRLAKTPQRSSRVTLIVFGQKDDQVQGLHWIHESGGSKDHNLTKPFDRKSIGYKVLSGALPSPHYLDAIKAKELGQDRERSKDGALAYRPFLTFRLNDSAILAIDWPEEPKDGDEQYVLFVRQLFQDDICRAITELLRHRHSALAHVVGLKPLPDPAPEPV